MHISRNICWMGNSMHDEYMFTLAWSWGNSTFDPLQHIQECQIPDCYCIVGHYTWFCSLLRVMFHDQGCAIIQESTYLINIFWVLILFLYIITCIISYTNYITTRLIKCSWWTYLRKYHNVLVYLKLFSCNLTIGRLILILE